MRQNGRAAAEIGSRRRVDLGRVERRKPVPADRPDTRGLARLLSELAEEIALWHVSLSTIRSVAGPSRVC